MKLQDKIDKYEEAVNTYDTALSSISGTISAVLNEPDITDWQARSVLRCLLATAAYYADITREELGAIDD